jgi:ubiquinone biosynthesis protein UbiJ
MLDALQALIAPAAMQRLTLLLNHVLASERVATERLARHVGRCIALQLRNWPPLLPAPQGLAFRVTPAGLLEWCGDAPLAQPDLHLSIDAGNPALLGLQWVAGERPKMEIQGDAAFAADVQWLADNLRWDIAHDLEGVFGPVVAREVARFGQMVAETLRRGVKTGAEWAERWRPGSGRAGE